MKDAEKNRATWLDRPFVASAAIAVQHIVGREKAGRFQQRTMRARGVCNQNRATSALHDVRKNDRKQNEPTGLQEAPTSRRCTGGSMLIRRTVYKPRMTNGDAHLTVAGERSRPTSGSITVLLER
jgi:hypothetical protein